MAAVMMDTRSGELHPGHPFNAWTYYLYCDQCGSFNIGHRLTGKTWAKIVVSLAMLGGAVAGLGSENNIGPCLFSVAMLTITFLAIFGRDFKYLDLACLKCGNRQITRDDVLDYGTRDKDALFDVPIQKIVKYEIADG
ncbi:MAG: hypothetical protein JXM73_25110 [Anaerolineae bacterium]|nr:hypothetical protein [Anaerolineae bacterium]